jgi:hypothetical protein
VARRGVAPLRRRMHGFGTLDFFRGAHFVLDRNRDDVLNCRNYVMGRCAWRVPAHFIFRKDAAQGSAKRLAPAAAAVPRTFKRQPPVAGLDAGWIDPTRVEAGLNRLLLPCPARLRPAEPGSNRWTPQSIGDDPPGPRLRARWPWTRPEVEARDAQACVRTERSNRGIALSLVVVLAPLPTAPAFPDRPVRLRTGAAAPPSDATSHPGGRRGDVSFTRLTKGVSMRSP